MLEIGGKFETPVIAVERSSGIVGPGKLVATRAGLSIIAHRQAAWAPPVGGCLAAIGLAAVAAALVGLGGTAYGAGRLAGYGVFPALLVGWYLGHAIAPRTRIEVVVPWSSLASAWGGERKLGFRIADGELRGIVSFAGDHENPNVARDLVRKMRANRFDA